MDMRKSVNAATVSAMVAAVAEQLRAERAASGLTIDALAKRAGLGRNTIMRFESGERSPNVEQLSAITDALGLTLTTLLVRAQDRVDAASASSQRRRRTGGVSGA